MNDAFEPKLCSVRYTQYDSAVVMAPKLDRGALLVKYDILCFSLVVHAS